MHTTLPVLPAEPSAKVKPNTPRAKAGGVIIGEVREVDADGRVWIALPSPWDSPESAFSCLCSIKDLTPGRRVAVMFQDENSSMAVVLGPVVADLQTPVDVAPRKPRTINLEADEEITLRCGKASIQLLKDGSLRIRGKEVLSRASGTNRIRGGNVQIN